MCVSYKISNTAGHILTRILITVSILFLITEYSSASNEIPSETGSTVLVLQDCDSDNKLSTPPYGDTASLLDSRGRLIKVVARDLRITDGCSGLSISEDGRFFAVCERESNRLVVYEIANGMVKWYLPGISTTSTVFAKGMLYAYTPGSIFVIDNTGTIVKHVRISIFDMAFDQAHDCFWISGLDVKKYNLDLEPVLTVKRIKGIRGPLLVEVNPDGSIWIAQGDASEQYGSENRLVKISPDGGILKKIDLDFSPIRLRIDRSDGSVWTTGRRKERDFSRIGDEWPETIDELNDLVITKIETFTRKYDSEGSLIFEISEGGYSIELDPSDGSAWIAGKKNIWHYSAKGQNLTSYAGSSDGQKWLAIVPGKKLTSR